MKRLILLLSSLIFMLSAAVQAQDDELQEVTFFLTFVPNVQFAPAYVAIENGYFADEGMEIVIEHGDEPVGVDLIAAGRIPFGIISGEQVLMARAAERPVVYVYEWFQKYPVGIVVPQPSEIETVADLSGKVVGIPGRFGASYSGLTALLGVNDLSEADIDLQEIGFAAADVVCAERLDASVVYINNEPLQIGQRADAGECGDISGVEVFNVSDYIDLVSNGLVTSEEMIAENPETVAAFVRAFDSGLRDAINNPAEAYLISLNYVENLPADEDLLIALEGAAEAQRAFLATEPDAEAIAASRETLLAELQALYAPESLIQFEVLLETIKLWEAEQPGMADLASFETTQALLRQLNMMEADIDLEAAFTNDFVPVMAAESAG